MANELLLTTRELLSTRDRLYISRASRIETPDALENFVMFIPEDTRISVPQSRLDLPLLRHSTIVTLALSLLASNVRGDRLRHTLL